MVVVVGQGQYLDGTIYSQTMPHVAIAVCVRLIIWVLVEIIRLFRMVVV